MFYILPWQFEWMNMSFTFSTEIYHYMVAIFVSGEPGWLNELGSWIT